MQLVDIKEVINNEDNPRFIKDGKFEKLVKSIKEFPEMLKLRPIVVNKEMIVLGGNMRLKACKEAGLKQVWILKAEELTKEQEREFIVKDNVGFGEWNWDILANVWDNQQLEEWGLQVWHAEEDTDYSILDDDDISNEIDGMKEGVKRALLIEFEPEHYEQAVDVVKFWRKEGAYVGKMMLEHFKAEKLKLEK